MPRKCAVCVHPQRLEIEQAIIAGTSLRDIAGRYGTAKTNIARDRTHVTETIARNKDAQDLPRTGALIDDVRASERRAQDLCEKAYEILTAALRDNDPRTALQAIRAVSAVMGEARGYLELRGELSNELGRDRTQAPVSIQILYPGSSSVPQKLPRVTYNADVNQIEAAAGDCVEIGIHQLG
jgi:hypothetical protein